jgi:putative flippase GtrA
MSMDDARKRGLPGKMARFAVVGVANAAIDLGCFSTLLSHGVPPLAANAAGWAVAVCFSFVVNRVWSFERDPHLKLHRSFLRFVSLGALVTLGVSNLALVLFAGVVGVWPAKIGGLVAAAALNFLAARWSIESRLLL